MRINIHSCGKISVAHHLLDKLDVVGAFTEPRAECVSHVMYAKMRQQFRLTIFQFSLIHFFGVVGDGDTLDGPIDIMGTEKVTFPIPKKETVIHPGPQWASCPQRYGYFCPEIPPHWAWCRQ